MSYSKLPNDTDCNETTMVVKNFKFDDVYMTKIVKKIILKTIKLWLIFIYVKIECFLNDFFLLFFLNNKQTNHQEDACIYTSTWVTRSTTDQP